MTTTQSIDRYLNDAAFRNETNAAAKIFQIAGLIAEIMELTPGTNPEEILAMAQGLYERKYQK